MNRVRIASRLMLASLLLMGCASNVPFTKESEKGTVSVESSKKYEEVTGELKALRMAIVSLRSEVEQLGALEKSLSSLRSDMERQRSMERALPGLRSDIEKLKNLEPSLSSLQWEMERMKSLGSHIALLRSEVAKLGEDIQNLETRPPLTAYKLPREVSLCG